MRGTCFPSPRAQVPEESWRSTSKERQNLKDQRSWNPTFRKQREGWGTRLKPDWLVALRRRDCWMLL